MILTQRGTLLLSSERNNYTTNEDRVPPSDYTTNEDRVPSSNYTTNEDNVPSSDYTTNGFFP